jgi:hypothetical protein
MAPKVTAIDHAAQGQVADEAPQPDSIANATARDAAETEALQAKLQSNQDAGANVMNFDEEASPEQKGAQARALAQEKVKPVNAKAKKDDTGAGECFVSADR